MKEVIIKEALPLAQGVSIKQRIKKYLGLKQSIL